MSEQQSEVSTAVRKAADPYSFVANLRARVGELAGAIKRLSRKAWANPAHTVIAIGTAGGAVQNFLATHKDVILSARYHGYLLMGLGAIVGAVELFKAIRDALNDA